MQLGNYVLILYFLIEYMELEESIAGFDWIQREK